MLNQWLRELCISSFLLLWGSNIFAFGDKGYRAVIKETFEDSPAEIIDYQNFKYQFNEKNKVTIQRYPQSIVEGQEINSPWLQEIIAPSKAILDRYLRSKKLEPRNFIAPSPSLDNEEIVTLVDSGPSSNRIDLVFMGDGYTSEERAKFFADINRLVDDMFRGETFNSYLPVFNVHAIFKASNESGIGKNDKAKDTAYRLYRAGNTLRAIYPGDRLAIRASCKKAPGCDYPIVIANDPYYGGLGGEVAISTSSPTSGTVVLRHELGHNFGRVGEEYDGGGYFGKNNSRSATKPHWKHWLSAKAIAQPAKARLLSWPWHNLESSQYQAQWESNGEFDQYSLTYSASGVASADSMSIEVDGKDIDFQGNGHIDRSFNKYSETSEGFNKGKHKIVVKKGTEGNNRWFSNIAIHEYAANYVFDKGYVNSYPVFSQNLRVMGYRPTHDTCLMRDMTSKQFCSVCQENNWHEFFKRIKPIDQVKVSKKSPASYQVQLHAVDFPSQGAGISNTPELLIDWFKDGNKLAKYSGLKTITVQKSEAAGKWQVRAKVVSSEIKTDPNKSLSDTEEFEIN